MTWLVTTNWGSKHNLTGWSLIWSLWRGLRHCPQTGGNNGRGKIWPVQEERQRISRTSQWRQATWGEGSVLQLSSALGNDLPQGWARWEVKMHSWLLAGGRLGDERRREGGSLGGNCDRKGYSQEGMFLGIIFCWSDQRRKYENLIIMLAYNQLFTQIQGCQQYL